MKQLFIPTGLSSQSTVGDLEAGKAAFMVYNGSEPALTNTLVDFTDLANDEEFSIVWKRSDNTVATSMPMTLNNCTGYDFAEYDAGTAQETSITPVDPSGFAQDKGDVYTLKVIKTYPATFSLDSHTYEVVHTGTDFTSATLIDAFVTAINTTDLEASKRLGIKAEDSDPKLNLIGYDWSASAEDPETHFQVACSEYLQGSTISYDTDNIPAIGTYKKIAALEEECESFSTGIQNKVKFPVKRPISQADSSTTYDIAVLYFVKNIPNKDGTQAVNSEKFKIYIAEDTDHVPSIQVAYQIYNRLATNASGGTVTGS